MAFGPIYDVRREKLLMYLRAGALPQIIYPLPGDVIDVLS